MSPETQQSNSLYPLLTEEQREVVDAWGVGVAVLAGAGSGKTTTLVEKCAKLLERNPKARLIAVSFTERSAADIKLKLRARFSLEEHRVTTIHGLCGSIVRDFAREAGLHGDERVMNESESRLAWERALETLWTQNLTHEVSDALETLLARESMSSLQALVTRVRSLAPFGVLNRLGQSEDGDVLHENALIHISEWVLKAYEREKRRSGVLDFDDLERFARVALSQERVSQAFRRDFDLVVVDEFQDTNPVQAEIITRIARSDRSNICVVGDPKQSIYRFRDAEVGVFEEFCQSLPKKISLNKNFRSEPEILDYVNEVCGPVFRSSKMEYEPLKPGKEKATSVAPVLRLEIESPEHLAEWLKRQAAGGVPLGKFALLMRALRGGGEAWLDALSRAGIPLAIGSGGFYWSDSGVHEVVALLKFWTNPANRFSAAVFLRAPWVGISDATLDVWIKSTMPEVFGKSNPSLNPNPTLNSIPSGKAITSLEDLFFQSNHPLAQLLLPLWQRKASVRPGELISEILKNPSAEQILGSAVRGLEHRCDELSAQGLTFRAVVEELSRSIEEGRRERDVPPPRDQGLLSVLSFHSAKGLEFDHVILVDLQKKSRARPAPLLFWDRHEGAVLGQRGDDGERLKSSPLEMRWRERESEKDLRESKRIFYVGLTRAKERLIFVTMPRDEVLTSSPKPKSKKAEVSPLDIDFWGAWVDQGPALPSEDAAKYSGASAVVGAATGTASSTGAESKMNIGESLALRTKRGRGRARSRHSVTDWNRYLLCPKKFVRGLLEGAPNISGGRSSGDADTAKPELSSREIGTRVHEALEWQDSELLRKIETESQGRFRANPVIEWAATSEMMQAAAFESELSFEVEVGSHDTREVLVGSIDRLSRTKQGRLQIIDFKVVSHLNPSEILRHYETQMKLYAFAMQRQDQDASRKGNNAAWLVAISREGVKEIPVPLPEPEQLESFATALARDVARALESTDASSYIARPSPDCAFCEFRESCPESQNQTQT